MVRRRANACWKMLTDPEHTSAADIAAVFFEDCRERYYMHATDPPSPDDVAAVPCGEGPSPAVTRVFEMAARRRDPVRETDGSSRPSREELYALLGCGEVLGAFPTDSTIVAMLH